MRVIHVDCGRLIDINPCAAPSTKLDLSRNSRLGARHEIGRSLVAGSRAGLASGAGHRDLASRARMVCRFAGARHTRCRPASAMALWQRRSGRCAVHGHAASRCPMEITMPTQCPSRDARKLRTARLARAHGAIDLNQPRSFPREYAKDIASRCDNARRHEGHRNVHALCTGERPYVKRHAVEEGRRAGTGVGSIDQRGRYRGRSTGVEVRGSKYATVSSPSRGIWVASRKSWRRAARRNVIDYLSIGA